MLVNRMSAIGDFVRTYPVKTCARNETILLQDETPDVVFCVKSGFIKAYDIDTQGCEQLLWFGSSGDIFPMIWLFRLTPDVQYFFSAFTDVELYVVNRCELLEFLQKNPEALMSLTRKLVLRMNEAFTHLDATKKARADEKIAHALYFLSLRFGHIVGEGEYRVVLPLTHQDIANLLGLARETVTIELRKLQEKGYIKYTKTSLSVYRNKLEEKIHYH
jgi:CRP-like cAMP-binding protein